MGNSGTSKVVSIGIVDLGLVNGVEMELKELRYIKDLNWNLTSLGALDTTGYTCKIGKGTLEVWMKSTKVMESIKQDDLYTVLGLAKDVTKEEARAAKKIQ